MHYDDNDDDDDGSSSQLANSSSVLLCNLQVLEALQPRVEQRMESNNKNHNKRKTPLRHRDWIETQVVEYITNHTPSLQLGKFENAQKLKKTLLAPMTRNNKHSMKNDDDETNQSDPPQQQPQQKNGFGLDEMEALQIINLVPTEPVEVHLILPDLHERSTTNITSTHYQDQLLSTIGKHCQQAKKKDETNH